MLLQDFAGGVEVAAVAQRLAKAHVVDLRDVDRRVPRREQRRGADARGNLGGQRVHVVAEDGARVRIGIEVVAPRVAAELGLGRAHQIMARLRERILARPHLLHHFQAGVITMRMDAEQPPTFAEGTHQRRHHLLRLEFQRRASAVGLRGDDHVVLGLALAALRDHVLKQESVIIAVQHQRRRMLVDRVATLRAVARLPVLGEKRLERRDLLAEIVRGGAGERRLVPNHRRGVLYGARLQPRRLAVVHVGDDEHSRRMLEEAVGHLA